MSFVRVQVVRRVLLCLCILPTSCAVGGQGLSFSARQRRSEMAAHKVEEAIEADIALLAPSAHVGVHAVLLADNRPWVNLRAEERFVPASVLKLYTAAAALSLLGPAHRIRTVFATDRFEQGGRALHNLYIRGEGDPTLGVGDLSRVAQAIFQLGVTRVTGEIVVDNGAFDDTAYGQGWMWDDLTEGYSAPIAATGVQKSAITLQILPGYRAGQPVRLVTEPATHYVQLYSQATTTPVGGARAITVAADDAPAEAPLMADANLRISGVLPLDASPVFRNLAVQDAGRYTATLLREHLLRVGVASSGAMRAGVMPADAAILSLHHSPPLSDIVQAAVKASDNYAIETLVKHLGLATDPQAKGSWSTGLRAIRRFLAEAVGPEAARSSLVDGSGVSRYSLVTPVQLTALLGHMHKSFSAGPEFIAALPIGGEDGTLIHRFASDGMVGAVRAKTGTMRGIGALSGFARTWDGEVLAFALLIDDHAGSAETLRALHERIVKRLVAYP